MRPFTYGIHLDFIAQKDPYGGVFLPFLTRRVYPVRKRFSIANQKYTHNKIAT